MNFLSSQHNKTKTIKASVYCQLVILTKQHASSNHGHFQSCTIIKIKNITTALQHALNRLRPHSYNIYSTCCLLC